MFESAPKSYKDPFWKGLAQSVESEVGLPSGLLQNVLLKGERSNADQVSSAGARTPFQIIPQTRKAVQEKYGVDAYASPENAAKAAALLLKESLDRNQGSVMKAVQEYHGGTNPKNYGPINRDYVKRVLGDMEPQTSRVDELVRMFNERKKSQQTNYGQRVDGTQKGSGFLGAIKTPDGQDMTELSVGVDFGQGEMQIPTLVPTLTPQEIETLRTTGQPTDAIVDKAVAFAKQRIQQGLPVFATAQESPQSAPQAATTSRADELVRMFNERKAKQQSPQDRESLIAQIPTESGAPIPESVKRPETGVLDVAEAGLSLLTGAVGAPIGMAAGAVGGLVESALKGQFGTQEGVKTVEEAAQRGMQGLTYQPRREGAQRLVQQAGETMAEVLPPVLPMIGQAGAISQSARMAAPQVAQSARAVAQTAKALPARIQERLTTFDRLAQRQGSVGAQGVDVATQRREAAQELPVPIELTKGQATRDFEQTRFERETAKNPEQGAPLRERFAQQNKQILMNMDSFIDQTGAETVDRIQTGKVITGALMERAKADKDKIRALYDRAEKSPEARQPIRIDSVVEYINNNQAETAVSPVLKFTRAKMVELGIASEAPDGTLQSRPITLVEGERLRKAIGNATSNDAPDIRQSTILKGLYDTDTESSGGELYKAARRARENYAKRFENRAVIADLLETKRNSDDRRVALEDVQSRIIDKGSREDLSILMGILDNSGEQGKQALKELRGATLMKIKEAATKSANTDDQGNPIISADKLNSTIRALDQDGKLERLYGKKGAEQLRTLADVSKVILTVPPGSVNYSNTASVLAGLVDVALTAGTGGIPAPLATTSRLIVGRIKDKKLKKKVEDALKPNSSKDK